LSENFWPETEIRKIGTKMSSTRALLTPAPSRFKTASMILVTLESFNLAGA
jgi:hypothetical protein